MTVTDNTALMSFNREWDIPLTRKRFKVSRALSNIAEQFTGRNPLSNEAVPEPSPQEKRTVKLLLNNLTQNDGDWQQDASNA